MSPPSRTGPAAARQAGAVVGKYRLLALAGQGGMGTVWKAEDTTLDRVVALKFLAEPLALQPRARRRFVHEARAAGRLTHPGIATVFEIAEIGGELAIAIRWIEGDTVAERVERGPIPVAEALRIAREAASALAHAHAHGVLHRDVSARNIMVARTGEALVLDFGLALPEGTSRLSSSGATIGTLAYLAPEIIVGQPASARSDVYSLGVVLYEMLTGSRPFRAERPEAILYAAVNEPVAPPSEKCAGLRHEVDALVLKAMARDPLERHEGAAALAAALRELEAAEGRPHERAVPTRSRRSRRSRGATAGAPSAAAPGQCYVVVVPFENAPSGADPDPRREWFALGLTETVRAQLGRYPGVHVVVPSSGSGPDATAHGTRALAREAGADFVLRGSIQQSGTRLRLTFELLDPLEGVQLASDVLDGGLDEVFSLQDLLVRHVAHALRPGLASVTAMADRAGLEPVAAQQRYLQAVGYLQRSDSEAQVDGALALLTELQASGHDSALVEAALGRAFLYKYQLTHDPVWEERAEAACGRAAALDPKSPDVHLTLGDVQRVSGRPAEAVRSFRRALRLRPDSPDALTGLARSLQAAGRTSDAEKVFRRAITLRPSFWEPYHLLGGLLFNRGRYDEAIALWRRVIELTPDNVRAHYNLGGALFRLERFEEAIDVLGRSIAIRPEATAYSNLGTVHYFLGHAEQSATMFEQAVALRPSVPRLWGNLGDAYRWMPGREADADAAYDRAIELIRGELEVNARDALSLAWLAIWLARRGQARDARREMERALRAAPEDVNVMACAVTAFSAVGDTARALEWLERALCAGYGLAEFERDPDLRLLRAEPRYASIVHAFAAAAPARHRAPSGEDREEHDPQRGGV